MTLLISSPTPERAFGGDASTRLWIIVCCFVFVRPPTVYGCCDEAIVVISINFDEPRHRTPKLAGFDFGVKVFLVRSHARLPSRETTRPRVRGRGSSAGRRGGVIRSPLPLPAVLSFRASPFAPAEPFPFVRGIHASTRSASPLRRRTGRPSIQASTSDSIQATLPPRSRERGNFPSRIHFQIVGKVTPTRSSTSGLDSKLGRLSFWSRP